MDQISTGDELLIVMSRGVANNLGVPRSERVTLAFDGVLTASTFFLNGLIGVFIGVFIGVLAPALTDNSEGKTELRNSSLLSRCSWKFKYELDTDGSVSFLDFLFFLLLLLDLVLPLAFKAVPPGV